MGKVNWFRGYLQELQDEVEGINRNKIVIDDSMLTKFLDDHSTDFNALLVGVLPDFNSKAREGDDYMQSAATQLMVLVKTSYSEVNYDEFFDIFEETYLLAEEVVKKLINDSLSGCNNLRFLNAQSITITPVWNRSSCNGWRIAFNFDLSL